MRIIFLIRSLHIGGAERQLTEIAAGLRRRGHFVQVVLFYREGAFLQALEASGCEVSSLGKTSRWDIAAPVRRFAAIVRQYQPDVIYSFMQTENILAWLARLLGPRVPLVWGIRIAGLDPAIYGPGVAFIYSIERRLLNRPDCIIANSRAALVERQLEHDPRAHVVPNGIDGAAYRPDADSGRKWRHEHGFATDALLIGTVGRVDPMKRTDIFIDAASRAVAAGSEAHYLVIGPAIPAYLAELQASPAARSLGDRLHWVAPQARMREVFNALDCLVSSSDSEGFSNVLAEGMACGTPVIATAVGDSRDLVGSFGTVVPRRDPAALAIAMLNATSPDVSQREARHRYIAESFSIERLIASTERILSALPAVLADAT